MKERAWTNRQLQMALKGMFSDLELLTPTQKRTLKERTFTVMELRMFIVAAVKKVVKENKELKRELKALKEKEQPPLFSMGQFTQAPPNWQEAYRREFLQS